MVNMKHMQKVNGKQKACRGFLVCLPLTFCICFIFTFWFTITGQVSDQESMTSRKAGLPQQFAAAIAQSKTTARFSYTPVFLGEDAAEIDGVVFHLQTINDNGQPGSVCINTSSVTGTNNIKANTLLRILVKQTGKVDMSK